VRHHGWAVGMAKTACIALDHSLGSNSLDPPPPAPRAAAQAHVWPWHALQQLMGGRGVPKR
jgi:hypothetical protein